MVGSFVGCGEEGALEDVGTDVGGDVCGKVGYGDGDAVGSFSSSSSGKQGSRWLAPFFRYLVELLVPSPDPLPLALPFFACLHFLADLVFVALLPFPFFDDDEYLDSAVAVDARA